MTSPNPLAPKREATVAVPMTAAELRRWASERAEQQLGPGGDATPDQQAAYWSAVASSVDNWGELWFCPRGYDVDLTPDWRQA